MGSVKQKDGGWLNKYGDWARSWTTKELPFDSLHGHEFFSSPNFPDLYG